MRKLFFLCLLLCAVCARGESDVQTERATSGRLLSVSEERDGHCERREYQYVRGEYVEERASDRLPGVWCLFPAPTWTPLQVALFHTKLFTGLATVYGLNANLNIINSQQHVFGVTVGTVNNIENHYGLLTGLLNVYERKSCGLAVAGLGNIGTGNASIAPFNMSNDDVLQIGGINLPFLLDPAGSPALQMGIVNGNNDTFLQIGLFNTVGKNFLQLGFLNARTNKYPEHDGFGTQFGGFNFYLQEKDDTRDKKSLSGCLQIGLFNCETLHGVQIGLLNYNPEAPVPWMPLFNFSFAPSSEPVPTADDPENGL